MDVYADIPNVTVNTIVDLAMSVWTSRPTSSMTTVRLCSVHLCVAEDMADVLTNLCACVVTSLQTWLSERGEIVHVEEDVLHVLEDIIMNTFSSHFSMHT